MAFQQVTVENRVSEFPNRRTLTKEDNTTEIVTVTRNEGNVSTEGTAWGAAYANDLESRINTETNLLETNFGHVETNTTASKSYSVEETLVLNGQMYKVTAAIAQGAALVVGTNIAVHSVSAINSNMNGLAFAQDGSGNWGYKVAGADPVIPFSSFRTLWTNSAPASAFAAQTVSLNLSKCTHVAVKSTQGNIFILPISSQRYISDASVPSLNVAIRQVTVSNTGVDFSAATTTVKESNGSFTTNYNNVSACIPLKIYGIQNFVD